MSITSRITRPWLSWLGIISLALIVIAVIGAIIFPMFSRSRSRPMPRMATMPSVEMKGPAPQAVQSPAPIGRSETPSITGVAWAASMNRMVIYTAQVSLETTSIEKQHKEIAGIARKAGGFITSSGVQNSDGSSEAEITLRVPQQKYAATLDAICKLGRLLSKSEEGEDVTEEYVDLQSRLRNLKREEEAFLTVLGKSSRITDILAVERELSRVRGEIETSEGRIKYLRDRIDLATITVSLSEPQTVVTNIARWDIWNTGKGAVNSLSAVFRGITSLIIWLVIFIPLWAVLWIVVYGVKRRIRGRRSA